MKACVVGAGAIGSFDECPNHPRGPALSPADDEALPPDIGGAEKRSMRRIHARQRCACIHHERADDADLVAEPSERFRDAGSDSILELKSAGVELMIAKALNGRALRGAAIAPGRAGDL